MSASDMSVAKKQAEFVAFCIENYKMMAGGWSGDQVAVLFEKYGLVDFLFENYDLLHTLGRDQILAEIRRYLEKRGA